MKTGLLWYDGDPTRSLEEKVLIAARRFRRKYDRHSWPNKCHVHPQEMNGVSGAITVAIPRKGPEKYVPAATVRVIPDPTTLINHFWIGREEQEA